MSIVVCHGIIKLHQNLPEFKQNTPLTLTYFFPFFWNTRIWDDLSDSLTHVHNELECCFFPVPSRFSDMLYQKSEIHHIKIILLSHKLDYNVKFHTVRGRKCITHFKLRFNLWFVSPKVYTSGKVTILSKRYPQHISCFNAKLSTDYMWSFPSP